MKILKEPLISYGEFLSKMKPLINFNDDLPDEIINQLSKTSFYQWNFFHKLLQSSILSNTHNSLDIVKSIIKAVFAKHEKQQPTQQVNDKLSKKLAKEIQILKAKFPSLISLDWQKYLIVILYHTLKNLSKKAIQLKLSNGHGKSILIQLLAQMLKTKLIIVCYNTFLQYWSRQLYHEVEIDRIQYVSLVEFLRMEPDSNATVIIDEIAIMNGLNSFYLDYFDKQHKCYYLQSLLKQYNNWIGFSATFSVCGRKCTQANFVDSIFIDIQHINEKALDNALIAHKIYSDELKDKEEAKRFYDTYEKPKDKKVLLINDFYRFQESVGKIQQLMSTDFIAITTREGGIGVDLKGVDIAHVVIAFEYTTLSELKQALGRGSRNSNKRCTGTLLTPKELDCESVEDVFQMEDLEDQRFANNITIMDKAARFLHGRVFAKEQLQVMQDFRNRMRKGMNFVNEENVADSKGEELFDALKNIFDPEGKYLISVVNINY